MAIPSVKSIVKRTNSNYLIIDRDIRDACRETGALLRYRAPIEYERNDEMRRKLWIVCIGIGVAMLLAPQISMAFYCGHQLVSIGDTTYEVQSKCGPPVFVDHADSLCARRSGPASEVWTYDFGPSDLVHMAMFLDGRLHKVKTGGYGIKGRGTKKHSCTAVVRTGSTRYEVYKACGAPTAKRRFEEHRDIHGHHSHAKHHHYPARICTTVEEWTYDFGPSRFIRQFRFENGRVTKKHTGGYGYVAPGR